jgi:transposase-like protein
MGEKWKRPCRMASTTSDRSMRWRTLACGIVIITDKLKSYGAATRESLPGVEHRQHRYLNNRAENSHQPTRQRERRMQGLKSPHSIDFSGNALSPSQLSCDCNALPPSCLIR